MHLFRDLALREKEGNPVKVAVIGAGFFGSGLIRQLVHSEGIHPVIIANRTIERVLEALQRSGVPSSKITVCSDVSPARRAIEQGQYVVTGDLNLPYQMDGIEVVAETTGDMIVGAASALKAIQSGKHFVAANPEVQATLGAILRFQADQAGVIYSDMDGDQPGYIQKLIEQTRGAGFLPIVGGNCKGVMKRYATPETQAAYCKENNIKPWIATAAADGTKLSMEMCILANANGFIPAVPGMTGVQTSLDNLLTDFERAGLLDKGGIVEYTLGIPVGTFVIAHNDDPWVASEMQYFKMGKGPHYLFFSPHVLCQYESVPSIAEAALYGSAVITPLAENQATEVIAYAKKDLDKDRRLDGIGGFDCYGQIVSRRDYLAQGLLPIGLAEFARLKNRVAKDAPIRFSDVDIEENNIITRLREEQEQLFKQGSDLSGSPLNTF